MKKRPAIPALCAVLAAAASLTAYRIYRTDHVFFGRTVYPKDVTELSLYDSELDMNELNKCTALRSLRLWGIADDVLTGTENFPCLKELYLMDCDLSGTGIAKLRMYPALDDLLIMYSRTDLSTLQNDSLTRVSLLVSAVSGIAGLADCPALKELYLAKITLDDAIVVTEGTDSFDRQYCLQDSTAFAALDNLETMWLSAITIADISGLLEMDALKTLNVSKGYISAEHIRTLEDHGITVVINTREE